MEGESVGGVLQSSSQWSFNVCVVSASLCFPPPRPQSILPVWISVSYSVKWGYYVLLPRFMERIQCHSLGKTWGQGLTLRNVSLHPPKLHLLHLSFRILKFKSLSCFFLLQSGHGIFFYNFPAVFSKSLSFHWEGHLLPQAFEVSDFAMQTGCVWEWP